MKEYINLRTNNCMTIFKTRIYYIAQNINRKDLKKSN